MTKYPNREALRKAHDIYRDAMRPFIIRCLRKVRGDRVENLIRDSLSNEEGERFEEDLQEHNENIEAAIDIKHFPHIIRKYWHRDRAFSQQFNSNSKVHYKTGTIADGRNLWAHPGVEDLDSDRTQADLTYVAEVLGEINNLDAKREVEDIRDQLFSDEVEEHPAEVENAALKENLANMTKQLDAEKSERTELEKQLKDKSDRLEEVEAEWIACDERLTDKSNLLESTAAENTELKKRLSEAENRLKTVEAESADFKKRFKTISDRSQEKAERAADQKGHRRAASKELTSEPKSSIAEKFRAANTLEDRVEIGRKVAELRINASGSKGLAWRDIRERLGLKNDEFHKVVRLEDHFHESVVERIESFKDGWEYSGKLESLLGFEPVGELANRIEACKPTPEEETPEHLPPNAETPDSITFQGTVFTRHLDKYHVAGNDITQSFWDYWRECKQDMRDAGWSVKKINGVWEVEISLEDFAVWMEEDNKPPTQPTRPPDQKTVLPTGKEMVQPALEFLSDRGECPRVEIINILTDHFSLTKNQREKLSRSGRAEVYLRNKGLIERTRTGYYRITSRGLEVLRRRRADEDSVLSNERYAETPSYSESSAKSPKSQRKWRRPGAVAALRDPWRDSGGRSEDCENSQSKRKSSLGA